VGGHRYPLGSANPIFSNSASSTRLTTVKSWRIAGSPYKSQPGPLRFIFIGKKTPKMVGNTRGSIARYPKFWGKGDEDVEQHLFLCESIRRSRGTLDANKLVQFQTTLRGRALKWCMKDIERGVQGQAFTLDQVHQKFIS
jgi:hypothetical protein